MTKDISEQERERMREGVLKHLQQTKDKNLQMFTKLTEPQAAALLGKDPSTLKRWRKRGLIIPLQDGDRNIYYLGYQVVDWYAFGVRREAA